MNKICVVKRDGSTEIFQAQKIYAAVAKAFGAAGDDRYSEYFFPLDAFEGRENVGVEEIQNAVVESLRVKFPNVATKYAEYRDKRERERKVLHTLMSKIEEVSVASSKDVDLKRENANVNGDGAMGMMLRIGSESAKAFYLNNLIDPKFADAHINGDIHIHDLDFYPMTTTCCQIDLKKLLEGGFGTGHGKLREPTGILSASALACIAIQSNQNDQHGGQSIPNFDYGLAPYVAKTFEKYYVEFLADEIDRLQFRRLRDTDVKGIERFIVSINDELKKKGRGARYFPNIDKGNLEGKRRDLYNECVYGRAEERQELCSLLFGRLDEKELDDKLYQFARAQQRAQDKAKTKTERETYQAMEALVHNLNSMHSRAGAQVPFSSINYGTDVSPEGFLVTESVLLAHEAGLGNGETPIFPIHIFRVKKGINFNEGEPNYYLFKLACRVSARRMFPNFVFQDAPFSVFLKTIHTFCTSFPNG